MVCEICVLNLRNLREIKNNRLFTQPVNSWALILLPSSPLLHPYSILLTPYSILHAHFTYTSSVFAWPAGTRVIFLRDAGIRTDSPFVISSDILLP